MPSKLAFDAATHTYRLDGQVVPSVTQILGEAGLVDGRWYTEESQLRGRTVHVITALDDRGELEESKVADEYRGYLDAWRRFKAEMKCEILSIEERVCNATYRYAGTTDRRLVWNGPLYIADIKAGVPEWWHKVQTGGYWMCDGIDAAARCTIYLKRDGRWNARVHEAHSYDTDVFRAALTLANAKRNEGITNGRNNGR